MSDSPETSMMIQAAVQCGVTSMNIREHMAVQFAAAAIAASGDSNGQVDYECRTVAREAVKMADAMILELSKAENI